MRITIVAVGRLKAGPERVLFERYVVRAGNVGRRLGLTFTTRELPESRAANAPTRVAQEASAVLAAIPPTAAVVTLDENGENIASDRFARRIAQWRDEGSTDVVFAIGGPDGLGAPLIERADLRLAFGAMTWPHQLVRSMLAEQLYRAVTILSGHPYHRG